MSWTIYLTADVEDFLDKLYADDRTTHKLVNQAILLLEQEGPGLGRPMVDTLVGSRLSNLKELRPGSAGVSEIRILFAFDPWRDAVLLIAGDKAGRWRQWYKSAIPRAEESYERYLAEREAEGDPTGGRKETL